MLRGIAILMVLVCHLSIGAQVTVAALLIPFGELVYRCIELPLAERGRRIAAGMRYSTSAAVPAAPVPVTSGSEAGEKQHLLSGESLIDRDAEAHRRAA